jgi:hypothetical protein
MQTSPQLTLTFTQSTYHAKTVASRDNILDSRCHCARGRFWVDVHLASPGFYALQRLVATVVIGQSKKKVREHNLMIDRQSSMCFATGVLFSCKVFAIKLLNRKMLLIPTIIIVISNIVIITFMIIIIKNTVKPALNIYKQDVHVDRVIRQLYCLFLEEIRIFNTV